MKSPTNIIPNSPYDQNFVSTKFNDNTGITIKKFDTTSTLDLELICNWKYLNHSMKSIEEKARNQKPEVNSFAKPVRFPH